MAENVDNLVLEQLRLMRSEFAGVNARLEAMESKIDDLKVGQNGLTALLVGLGHYVHSIDKRVEHIEERLGVPQ